ncbi:MAG: prepilin-type N-terminal cleavage/methylation domain-containing protein [Candidatus Aminicenantes bacterium]|nr:prepilin-type N-terminal cleavage/methylation domain-containing protein [Candidatus Aminicenantes bacterium]
MNATDDHKRDGAKPGFSLIEVIVTMSLACFLMIGTAEMLVLALRVQGRARAGMEMTDLVRARLEELRAETTASSEGMGLPFVDGSASAAGRGNRQYLISWTVDASARFPRLIEVRISPAGSSDRVALRIPLFVSPELGF